MLESKSRLVTYKFSNISHNDLFTLVLDDNGHEEIGERKTYPVTCSEEASTVGEVHVVGVISYDFY